MAVLRFTPGFLTYKKFGSFFEESLRFPDRRKHKFCHNICAYDLDVNVDILKMDVCMICRPEPCQFFCSVEPKEACLLVEQGYFQSMKGGLFVKFVPEKKGVVHWACARAEWKSKLLTPELQQGDLFDVSPT